MNLTLLESTIKLSSWYNKLELLQQHKTTLLNDIQNQDIIKTMLINHIQHDIAPMCLFSRYQRILALLNDMKINIHSFPISETDLSTFQATKYLSDSGQITSGGYIRSIPYSICIQYYEFPLKVSLDYLLTLYTYIVEIIETVAMILNIKSSFLPFPMAGIKLLLLQLTSILTPSTISSTSTNKNTNKQRPQAYNTVKDIISTSTSTGNSSTPSVPASVTTTTTALSTLLLNKHQSSPSVRQHKISSITTATTSASTSQRHTPLLYSNTTASNTAISNKNDSIIIKLQMNIVYLCMAMGLSTIQILPPSYLLHNLYLIKLKCIQATSLSTTDNNNDNNNNSMNTDNNVMNEKVYINMLVSIIQQIGQRDY